MPYLYITNEENDKNRVSMNIGLKNIIVPIFASFCLPASAQFAGNYFDAYLSGGVQTPTYSPLSSGVTHTSGIGGGIGIGYKHFFNDNLGVQAGFGVRFFNAYGKCQFIEHDSIMSQPALGTYARPEKIADVTTSYMQWTEKQKFAQLEIPLGICYQKEIGYKMSFQAGGGLLVGFPVGARFYVTEGSISQSQVLLTNPDQKELFNIDGNGDYERDLEKKNVSLGFFLDLGIHKWTKKGVGIYSGLFVNYTASDVFVPKAQPVTSANGVYNGILASNQVTDVNLLSVGLKFGCDLPIQKKKRKEDLPDNSALVAEEPIINVRDSITHLPDSLIYVRYSREKVAKVKKQISNMPEVEAIDAQKKLVYMKTLAAYDSLTSFEKLDITWSERGKLKRADYALNGEKRFAELCESMNSEIQFAYMQSGFTSSKTLESEFEDLVFLMKLLPNATLVIEGRADDNEDASDPALAKERALFLREILMKKGVAGDQIEIETLGAKNPVAPFTSDENRAKNRTVTFKSVIEPAQ